MMIQQMISEPSRLAESFGIYTHQLNFCVRFAFSERCILFDKHLSSMFHAWQLSKR